METISGNAQSINFVRIFQALEGVCKETVGYFYGQFAGYPNKSSTLNATV